jgi:hypothetical protein
MYAGKKISVCLGALLFSVYSLSYCWLSEKDKGTSGAQFLKIPVGSVGPSLGGAYTALGSDVSGLYWNPASVAYPDCSQAELMHVIWFEDTTLEQFAYSGALGPGRVGVSYSGMMIGNIERRSADTEEPEGKFESRSHVAGISYALIMKNNAFGATVKYINSTIDEWTAAGVGIDLGCRREMGSYTAGISVRNIGPEIKYENESDPLPASVNIGVAKKLRKNMSAALDLNMPRDNVFNISAGYEYLLAVGSFRIPLRAGFRTLNDFEIKDGFSAGIGMDYSGKYMLDTAWVPYGTIGDTYRITLKINF